MKQLLILLLHPAYVVHSRGRVFVPFLHLLAAGYLGVCGYSFQFLYPRLLNNVPWLGALRKLDVTTWNPAFDPELFVRGVAMGFALLFSYLVVYSVMGLLGRGKGSVLVSAYLAALSTCVPILVTCALSFGFYYLHDALGLVPGYGVLTAVCLHVIVLKDLYNCNRAFVVYFAPLVFSVQTYSIYLLLP